jgi:HrpA-like RNA helicase
MSATVHGQKISHYFSNCPILTVPGRMFDVSEHYLEHILSVVGKEQQASSRDRSVSISPEKEGIIPQQAAAERAVDSNDAPTIGAFASPSSTPNAAAAASSEKKMNVNAGLPSPRVDDELIAEFIIRLIQRENRQQPSTGR